MVFVVVGGDVGAEEISSIPDPDPDPLSTRSRLYFTRVW